MSDALADALAYAAQGLHVHPFHNLRKDGSCTCGKADCESPGKHPWSEHGKDDATTDPATIRALFKGKPAAQVGMNCGASGVVVLDVDVHGETDGRDTWAALVAEEPELDAAPMAETPNEGLHGLFRMNGDPIGCPGPTKDAPGGPLGAGIDVKGIGGSVILPSANSPERDWIPGHELGTLPLPELPRALAERLTYSTTRPERRRAAQEAEKAAQVGEGGRNAHLASVAGTMRRRGLSEAAILAALQQENAEHCDPPLAEREVEKIAASVGKYVPETPPAAEPDAAAPLVLPWMTGAQLAELVLPEPDYICAPYIARGFIAQLVAKTKGGKTELVRRLAAAVLTGRPFLGRSTTYTAVGYLAEESPASFGPPLEGAGIPGREDLHILFRNACGVAEWPEMAQAAREYVREHGIGLLIVDTGDPWLLRPGDDPNDAVTAEAAVRELQRIAGDGVAVVLLRHERKGGGDISDSGRGSSAFGGAVDVLLTLRAVGGSGHDNRRELEAIARAALPDVPRKVIIELEDGEYRVVGNALDVERQNTLEKILDNLPASRDAAVTVDELRELAGTAKTLTQDLLRDLHDNGSGAVGREKGAGSASARAFGYWLRGDDD